MRRIVCVYKSGGGHYGIDYVERLHAQIKTSCPWDEFVCLSDDERVPGFSPLLYDWEGWWSKMELFRPDIEGDILYFDLDTVICGDLYEIIEVCEERDHPIMLSDFYYPDRPASGVMWIPEHTRARVWNRWIEDPEGHTKNAGTLGDQEVIGLAYGHSVARWQSLLPGRFVSYKMHVIKKGVPNHIPICNDDDEGLGKAKVVCYHGKPRPRDTGWNALNSTQ